MSEHLCPVCGKYKTPDPSSFAPGVVIMFPRVNRLAHGVAVGTDIGVIAYEASPILFAVKCPDGRIAFARKREATHGDQNATLSIFLYGTCGCEGTQNVRTPCDKGMNRNHTLSQGGAIPFRPLLNGGVDSVPTPNQGPVEITAPFTNEQFNLAGE